MPKPDEVAMPKAPKAPTGRKAKGEREIKYPPVPGLHGLHDIALACGEDAIDAALAAKLLGYEDEPAYTARVLMEQPGISPTKAMFGDKYHFRDLEGRKVHCRRNTTNRPTDMDLVMQYAQDLLNRNWAGPTTVEGGSITGGAIAIDRYGDVQNGQKQLIAIIFARFLWERDKNHWAAKWPEDRYPNGPVMDNLIIYGICPDPKVVQCIDNTQPRSEADTFQTLGIFNGIADLTDRREHSRMLSKAVDLLWERTGLKDRTFNAFSSRRSNSEAAEFVRRHGRLEKCVKHIFEENASRAISNLKLSPGQCAGIMYLMAASASDGEQYRQLDKDGNLPGEGRRTDFAYWDKAEMFWSDMAAGKGEFAHVHKALKAIKPEVDGEGKEVVAGGFTAEKFAIIAKAWDNYVNGIKVTPSSLTFGDEDYKTTQEGERQFVGRHDFGGIDVGPKQRQAAKVDPTPEEVEAEKKAIREAKGKDAVQVREQAARDKAAKGPSATVAEPGSGKNGQPGKPPAPVANKPLTRKQQMAANTAAAKQADEDKATADRAAAGLTKAEMAKQQATADIEDGGESDDNDADE